MTETEKFYKWWTEKVKGDYISNESLETIREKLEPNINN